MAFRYLFLLSLSLAVLASCGDSEDQLYESSNQPVPYCSQKLTYSDPITITGTAQYEYRIDGNQAVSNPNPIRYAEVRVTNADGEIIQCAETDEEGKFSLSLPKDGSTALVSVVSRSNNNFLKLYVLKDPKTNTFHSLEQSVVLDSPKDIGSLVAPATGSLEGGAFNILDKILDANNFLKKKTENCQERFKGCIPFSVASLPMPHAYWSKGVNPNIYLGSQKMGFYSSESFFATDLNHIYILGGDNGDVDSFDTDHFDNTIIIHEYGHFIEAVYSNLDSPNGPHTGNDIIDPRLAFAEAWANFFQAQVTGIPRYRDTSGTIEGEPLVNLDEDLESRGSKDVATAEGEGNFREFAITRALIDIFDKDEDVVGQDENGVDIIDDVEAEFAEFWTLFVSKDRGLANEDYYFNNVGRLLELQKKHPDSDWSKIVSAEKLKSNVKDFGNSLVLGGSCEDIKIQAEDVSGRPPLRNENGTLMNSNLFDSNDFYEYRHEGGSFELILEYKGHTQGESPPPLDIYLYGNNYVFGIKSDVFALNDEVFDDGELRDEKVLPVSNLEAGVYMINILVHTGDSRAYRPVDYSMSIEINNGQKQRACPKE